MSDPAATVAKSTDVAVSLESKTHVHEQAQGLRGENPANAYAKLCTGGKVISIRKGVNAKLVRYCEI